MKSKKGGKKGRDEGDILARMDAFRGKLKGSFLDGVDDTGDVKVGASESAAADADVANQNEPPLEIDDDTDFLSHKLQFPKDAGQEENRRAERDYEVIDPRVRGARAREDERERKQKRRAPDGGRGFRR